MNVDPNSPLTAMHDPVPAQSCVGVCGEKASDGHSLEERIQRWLLQHPGLAFASLVVRRIPDGICIEGVLESDEGSPDLQVMLGHLPGVRRVVNNIRIVSTTHADH
ncbi:MAG: BON domain-containing protein [Planctomycetaceae bacterium]